MKRENFSRKREAILQKIRGTHIHPTAEWVYQELKNEYPDLSLGTVYRFLLHLLLALGNDDCRHRTVSYFADKLNIFARYFTAVCKQESGKTPSELIHERTIDRIRQLLQESDLSIK